MAGLIKMGAPDAHEIWIGSESDPHEEVAERLYRILSKGPGHRGPCRVALSGGATPIRLYHHLSAGGVAERIPWDRIHIFFADERCVPPDHPDSNYRLVRTHLLDRLPIKPAKVFRMEGEAEDSDGAARTYEVRIRSDFASAAKGMDVALLGIGADGHTASLFPGAVTLGEERRWALACDAPPGERHRRITLTLPLLNASREVWFLVTGEEKAAIVARLQTDEGLTLPAGMVRSRTARVTWFLDRAAASRLKGTTG